MSTLHTPVDHAREYHRFLVGSLLGHWVDDLLERAAVQPGEAVLDIACGTGAVTVALALQHIPGVTIAGLDLNPAMITVAEERSAEAGVNIEWTAGSALELPYPDNSFDVVLCQQGLQFMPDKARAAAEMRRVLRPGGRAVISVWQGLDKHPHYQVLSDAVTEQTGVAMGSPFSFGDASAFETLLKDAAFDHVAVVPLSKRCYFPDPDHYVQRIIDGGAAVMPELRQMNAEALKALIADVEVKMADIMAEARQGDKLVFPFHNNIAIAS